MAQPAEAARRKHPADLTREERADLLNFHLRKLKEEHNKVELARVPLANAQAAMTAQFNQAKADLGKRYTRKHMAGLLADYLARAKDQAETERQRFEDREDLGLPTYAGQPDLFDGKLPAEARDERLFRADGYMTGRRGDEGKPPEDVPERFVQAWMAGYHEGQAEIGMRLGRAETIRKELEEPPPVLAPPAATGKALDKQASKAAKQKKGFATLAVVEGGKNADGESSK